MNPQHSSPAPAVSRCSESLQVNVCTKYKLMHVKVIRLSRYLCQNLPYGRLPTYYTTPSEIGGRTRNTEEFLHPPNELGLNEVNRPITGCSSGSQRRITPIDNHIKFNRMNGSPGDPPANRMHISISQKFNLFIHYLVSIPTTRAANNEIQNFNHFLSLRTSSRTELAQARMRGPDINNNSTKNKG